MSSPSAKTYYHGKRVDKRLAAILKAGNIILDEPGDLTMLQGSFSGAVSASAGTHNGSGAMDITAYNEKKRIKTFRNLGMAIWVRPTRPGVWSRHIHGIVCGDATASYGARVQVQEYYKGQDGLAGSGRDREWRPSTLPIIFQFEASLALRYCTVECGKYDQPNARNARKGTVTVGSQVQPVAVVKVGVERWIIDSKGMCYFDGNFSTQKPGAVVPDKPIEYKADTTLYQVDADPSLYGLALPGSGNEKKASRLDGTWLQAKQSALLPNGQTWVQMDDGFWYSKQYLKIAPVQVAEIVTPGATTSPASATFQLGGINVAAYFEPGYNSRIPGLAKMRDAIGASVVCTQESGTYAQGTALSKAFGWAGDASKQKNVRLHGEHIGITNSVHWDPKKWAAVDGGKFQTYGPHHDWATWQCLKHIESGVLVMFVSTHLENLPKGANTTKTTYDTRRYKQMHSALSQAKEKAKALATKHKVQHIYTICEADCNGDRNDAYDGAGAAAKNLGFTDAEISAKRHVNGDKGTLSKYGPFTKSGQRIDRFFVENGLIALEQKTVHSGKATDHNGIGLLVTATNKSFTAAEARKMVLAA